MSKITDEPSHLQEEISSLTNILSLITKRLPDFEGLDNGPSVSELRRSEDRDINPESAGDDADEAEFEVPIAAEDVEGDAIKRRTLDRLAEVLARFKTTKGTRLQEERNRDAKHVASVIMLEELGGKSVTFYCSKNEGLDDVDIRFLRKLEDLLQNIAVKEAKRTVAPPIILTNRNVQEELHQVTTRHWEDNNGLHFSFRPSGIGEESTSDKTIDNLSAQEEETLVQETYSEIRHLFGNAVHQVSRIPMKNLLKNVYRIVRHPRQRPVLKGLLRQAVHNNKQLFKTAWDSLLFLTRIYFAAVTFADFATKLSPESIRFQPVPAVVTYGGKNSDGRSPTEALTSLGHSSLTREWRDFLQTPESVRKFVRPSPIKKTVHGEFQLILHVEDLTHGREKLTGKIVPYIGCSKKCCFFCELFRISHGTFQARGTHETIFPLWGLPQTLPQQSLQVFRRFSKLLRDILWGILAVPYPPPRRDLLQQSSAALSTAQAVQREELSFSTRPQTLRRMMLGPGGVFATEHHVEFIPSLETPGYADLMGGPEKRNFVSVPIEEAEMTKINHERRTYMLEEISEMPPTRCLNQKLCRRCECVATYRCSACWTWYCSKACQRRSWAHHVFVCRVSARPNDVDFLRLVMQRITKEINYGDEERLQNATLYVLADDHICRTFGFNNCMDVAEVVALVCIYVTMLSRIGQAIRVLQEYLQNCNLGDFMKQFCQLERHIAQVTNEVECTCVTWFLERCTPESLIIPNRDQAIYGIWATAQDCAIESLGLGSWFENGRKFNKSQADVFRLYIAIQPTIWQIPDIYSSSWAKFGFCYCKSFSQRAELARQYLALASSRATFDDIVAAYETSSLAGLMRTQGIDISELENQGVHLHRPPPCEYSVYRLMIGVEHALSGRLCSCFTVREGRDCHAYYETHIDRESDTHFGFHLTSSWERWQLLNFYKHLFGLPGFDPRCMAKATEDDDPGGLENYLDTLVPDMRRKIWDRNRANILFPRLKDRLRGKTQDGQNIPHFHLPCNCKEHDVEGPPGISYL